MSQEEKETESDCLVLDSLEDGLLKDTTEKEKSRVLQISRKICKYLSSLLFATGAISILLSAEYFIGARLLLSFELKTLFILAMGFVGVVNLISGLLLLAKE